MESRPQKKYIPGIHEQSTNLRHHEMNFPCQKTLPYWPIFTTLAAEIDRSKSNIYVGIQWPFIHSLSNANANIKKKD